jgi:hypothetical protein
MKFALPHWVFVVALVAMRVDMSIAQQFPQYAPQLNVVNDALALVTGSSGLASGSIFASGAAKAAERGFARLRVVFAVMLLSLLALFSIARMRGALPPTRTNLVGCAAFKAVAPQGQALEQCLEGYFAKASGDWETDVIGAAFHCGSDVVSVLVALADEADPSLSSKAKATLADPASMARIRARTGGVGDGGPAPDAGPR